MGPWVQGHYVHSLIPAHHIPCQRGRCTHLHTPSATISFRFFLPTQNQYRPPPTLVKLILIFYASPLQSLHFITPCTPPPSAPSPLQLPCTWVATRGQQVLTLPAQVGQVV